MTNAPWPVLHQNYSSVVNLSDTR